MNKRSKSRIESRDCASVLRLAEMLRSAISAQTTTSMEQLLRGSLRSQGRLAKYSSPDGNIVSMSLNHQKSVATRCLGSYEVLDQLRRAARSAAKGDVKGRAPDRLRPTRRDLEQRIKQLERQCQILREDLFLQQRAYDVRCAQARRYALAGGAHTLVLCDKEQRELDTGLSLRKGAPSSENVVALAGLGRAS